jgi:hypothetical protein
MAPQMRAECTEDAYSGDRRDVFYGTYDAFARTCVHRRECSADVHRSPCVVVGQTEAIPSSSSSSRSRAALIMILLATDGDQFRQRATNHQP